MTDILLIYPKLGNMDSMIMDIPLSIIYAAADAVKRGFSVKAVDLRAEGDAWKETIRKYLDAGVILVGVSVMTGAPLFHAREVSRFIKNIYPDIKIAWGGPHATVIPETIREDFLDFLIRGYGSFALAELISCLKLGGDKALIKGLSFKSGGKVIHNPRSSEHEILRYTDIPYHLIDVNSVFYGRSYKKENFFPIFTSMGCPYQCSFCVHPEIYKEINGRKWNPIPEDEVVEHIAYINGKFSASGICFIDDTSFPDIERMRRIFTKLIERKIKVTLEFRGARVNEIDSMDDDFLRLMVEAGGRTMMVGVESGSDRVLKSMQKGITKEQIFRINLKLARFPQLVPHYNFIYGSPSETYADLIETKDTVLRLLAENPQAYFGFGSDWKPVPGTKMLDYAVRHYGFKVPGSLDEWINIDSSDAPAKIVHPWYTAKQDRMIKLLQVASFVIDDKMVKESASNQAVIFRILRLLSRAYKPLALLRLKFNFTNMLIEYGFWRSSINLFKFFSKTNKGNKR